MLRRFLRRYTGVALGISAAMTWGIVFRMVPRPQDPCWSQLLRTLMVSSVLFFSQFGLSAVVDPEVGAKLREKLGHSQARLESRQARHKARRELLEQKDEEARRRLKEAWRELKGERRTKP